MSHHSVRLVVLLPPHSLYCKSRGEAHYDILVNKIYGLAHNICGGVIEFLTGIGLRWKGGGEKSYYSSLNRRGNKVITDCNSENQTLTARRYSRALSLT